MIDQLTDYINSLIYMRFSHAIPKVLTYTVMSHEIIKINCTCFCTG